MSGRVRLLRHSTRIVTRVSSHKHDEIRVRVFVRFSMLKRTNTRTRISSCNYCSFFKEMPEVAAFAAFFSFCISFFCLLDLGGAFWTFFCFLFATMYSSYFLYTWPTLAHN